MFLAAWTLSWAQSAVKTQINSVQSLTIVEVLGTLRGSGIIIDLDGRPVIITNSHNLQGQQEALIKLTYRVKPDRVLRILNHRLPVLFDFPRSDFAIIDIPAAIFEPAIYRIFTEHGQTNGSIKRETIPQGWSPNISHNSTNNHFIAANIDGELTTIKPVYPLVASLKDEMISIPAFSRPGVSGGGYYHHGQLIGLVSKVSLAGDHETGAITFRKIGKILGEKISDGDQGRWENGQLVLQVGDAELKIGSNRNGGGETGNGGGETGNGGGETGNGGDTFSKSYWTLEVSDWLGNSSIETWNPFYPRFHQFLVNEKKVAFIEKDKKLQLPNLELYSSADAKIHYESDESLHQLEEARRVAKVDVNRGRYFSIRPYEKHYRIWDAGSYLGNGSQVLVPNTKGKWPKAPNRFGAKSVFDTEMGKRLKDGYYFNIPFSSKRTQNLLLDTSVNHLAEPENRVGVYAHADLQRVTIKHGLQTYELERSQSYSLSTLIFEDTNQLYRVAYIYDAEDLATLLKIYVWSQDKLMEFWPCQAQPGCFE